MLCTSSIATLMALSSLSSAFISIPVHKNGQGNPPLIPNRLLKRDAFEQTLINNLTGGGYYAQVELGTPPQPVTLIVDTGSSDVWVLDKDADLCTNQRQQRGPFGGCIATYDKGESSTFELVDTNGFEIQYLSGEGSTGDYIKEDFHIGGTTIKGLQMGLAKSSDINSGLVGVGFGNSVSAEEVYPNIMDEFKSQGLIETMGYSLWLNDLDASTGNILFGGIDTEKFIGELQTIPMLEATDGNVYTFAVAMSTLALESPDGTFDDTTLSTERIPVILDSGTTLSYLPSGMLTALYSTLNAVDDTSGTGLVYVSCALATQFPDMEFAFTFIDINNRNIGVKIGVPAREMIMNNVQFYISLGLVLPRDLPFDEEDTCSLGLHAIDGDGAASRGGTVLTDIGILGDTFLRSAYVVYDLDNKVIGIARANVNSTESNVVEMTTGIPEGVTGVASQVPFESQTGGVRVETTTDGEGNVATVTVTAEAGDEESAGMRTFGGVDGVWQGGLMGAMVLGWAVVGGLMVVM